LAIEPLTTTPVYVQETFPETEDALSPLDLVFTDFAVNGISTASSGSDQEKHAFHRNSIEGDGQELGFTGQFIENSDTSNNIIMVADEIQPVFIENVASYEELDFEVQGNTARYETQHYAFSAGPTNSSRSSRGK
jgi:hypothetical protein